MPRGPSGHSPVSLFLGVLPGPFIQGRAPQLTVSLSSPPRLWGPGSRTALWLCRLHLPIEAVAASGWRPRGPPPADGWAWSLWLMQKHWSG